MILRKMAQCETCVFNPAPLCRIVIDNIARGYDVLYDERIVHRDIKPQNILVQYKDCNSTEIRTAKIADFGISRVLEPDTENDDCAYAYLSNVAGTLAYMAPEVGANLLKTCQYDFQVDMWSIGCVLYQCISGQVSFLSPCQYGCVCVRTRAHIPGVPLAPSR